MEETKDRKIKKINKLLRLDSPFPIQMNDRVEWQRPDGTIHRDDGPAIEHHDGRRDWVCEDNFHRVGGPAIEYADGSKEWWVQGIRHRENGPAIEYLHPPYREWFFNGKRHRMNGPAIEYADGSKEYWVNNKSKNEKEFLELIKKNPR